MPPPTTTGTSQNKPKPGTSKTSKPVGARLTELQIALNQVYHDTSKWNAFSLPLFGTLLLLFAVALIVVGATQNVEDIIIIGAIFILGSIIFYFLLYLNVCRPRCHRNQVSYERHSSQYDQTGGVVTVEEPGRYPDHVPDYGSFYDNEDLSAMPAVYKQPAPDESQLYGANVARTFLATPATTKDVNFMDEEMGTPPPPKVKSPLDRMASPPPKPALPEQYGRNASRHSKNVSFDVGSNSLELL